MIKAIFIVAILIMAFIIFVGFIAALMSGSLFRSKNKDD
jgi:hypothetical protein